LEFYNTHRIGTGVSPSTTKDTKGHKGNPPDFIPSWDFVSLVVDQFRAWLVAGTGKTVLQSDAPQISIAVTAICCR